MAGRKGRAKQSGGGGPRVGRWLGLGLVLLGAFAAYEYFTLPSAAPLRTQNPKTTALMELRAAEAREAGHRPRRKQSWVGLSSISKDALYAVVLSEDSGFFSHGGVDTEQLEKALGEAWDKRQLGRGASTLTQQLAKNLWLSTDRSLLRKAKELLLAQRLEQAMPKSRILTLYVNVVEWGDGLYGIEAAAREYFGLPAAQLDAAQGAILAAMLPAPRKRTPISGSPTLRRRAHWIIDQMRYVRRLTPEQAAEAHEELDQRLGASKPEDGPEGAGDDAFGIPSAQTAVAPTPR